MESNNFEADKPVDNIGSKASGMVIIAHNKPSGTGQESGFDINNIGLDGPIFPIGQSDNDSHGLVLLTNDINIAETILKLVSNQEKAYHITFNKPISKSFIQEIQSEIGFNEITKTGACSLSVKLDQGQDQKIRPACEYFGYDIVDLECTGIMHIGMAGLEPGLYRYLSDEETALFLQTSESSESTDEAPVKKRTRIPKKMPARGMDQQESELENRSNDRYSRRKPFRPERDRSENTERRIIKSRKSDSGTPGKKPAGRKRASEPGDRKNRTYSEYRRGASRNQADMKPFGREKRYSGKKEDESISSSRTEKPERTSTTRRNEEIRVSKKNKSGPRIGKSKVYTGYKKSTSRNNDDKAPFQKGKRQSGKPESRSSVKGKAAPQKRSISRKNIAKPGRGK